MLLRRGGSPQKASRYQGAAEEGGFLGKTSTRRKEHSFGKGEEGYCQALRGKHHPGPEGAITRTLWRLEG